MGKIYISDRPGDCQDIADRLHALLTREFGPRGVLRDALNTEPDAEDRTLGDYITACDAVLVLIGPDWLTAGVEEDGDWYLSDPDDVVRREISIALKHKLPVIPVLLGPARMPFVSELPPAEAGQPDYLAKLVCRHAWPLEEETFQEDAARLLKHVAKIVAKAEARQIQDVENTADRPKAGRRLRLPNKARTPREKRQSIRPLDARSPNKPQRNSKPSEAVYYEAGDADTVETRDETRPSLPPRPSNLTTDDIEASPEETAAWAQVNTWSEPDILAYLEKYPRGAFAPLAYAAMDSLSAMKQPAQQSGEQAGTDPRARGVVLESTLRTDPALGRHRGGTVALALEVIRDWLTGGLRLAALLLVGGLALTGLAGLMYTLSVYLATGAVFRLEPDPSMALHGEAKSLGAECKLCPTLIALPEAEFTMGSRYNDPNKDETEGPLHTVTIKPFAIAAKEVTVAQWQACVKAEFCRAADFGSERYSAQHPAVNISWRDITGIGVREKGFLLWLNSLTDTKGYRLPTEAEWEFAARAGTLTQFSWGDRPPVCEEDAANGANYSACPDNAPRKTARYSANAFGLYDMHGNVWELVQDCWHRDYYGAPSDGRTWMSANEGDCTRAVVRGGSWSNAARGLRSAYRASVLRTEISRGLGFRVAKSLLPSGD